MRQLEYRGDLYRLAVFILDRIATGQRRVDLAHAQGIAQAAAAAGRLNRTSGTTIPDIKDFIQVLFQFLGLIIFAFLVASHDRLFLHQVTTAQQLAIVPAHQERQVGLFTDERLFIEFLLEGHMHQRHSQERIAARLDMNPFIRMNGSRVVIRGDGNDLGLVVSPFPQIVGIRNTGDVGIDAPEHDVVHLVPGIQ